MINYPIDEISVYFVNFFYHYSLGPSLLVTYSTSNIIYYMFISKPVTRRLRVTDIFLGVGKKNLMSFNFSSLYFVRN